MFQQRTLYNRKRKLKVKIKLIFVIFVILLITAIGLRFLYSNFTQVSLISPLAKSKLSKVANLENEFEKIKVPFASITTSSNSSFTVKLLDGGEVILSSKKDIGSQLSSLQLILARLTIEGKKLKILDFRFDNTVVSF